MNEILNAKEIEKRLPDLKRKREGLQEKLSKEQTKGKALQDKLEDKTLDLFDRAVRALKGGESIKAKNQILYNDLQISEKLQKDLTEELTELDENIQILDSENRKAQNNLLVEETKKLLIKLQESQVEQFKLLQEVAAKRDEIESNIGVRFVDRRTDFVKVRITDQNWRQILLPKTLHSQTVLEPDSEGKRRNLPIRTIEAFVTSPGTANQPVYQFFSYQKALELVKRGMAEIIEDGGVPTYEQVCVRDPEPEILKDLIAINLGTPITISDKKIPFFSEIEKEVGWCQLDLNLIKTLRR